MPNHPAIQDGLALHLLLRVVVGGCTPEVRRNVAKGKLGRGGNCKRTRRLNDLGDSIPRIDGGLKRAAWRLLRRQIPSVRR